MKVKVRNENYESPFVIAFIELVFIGVPLSYFIVLFKESENFGETIIKRAAPSIVLLMFLILGIILLISIIKPPKRYVAKLVSKKKTKYKDNNICEMRFEIVTDKEGVKGPLYSCYTDDSNNLEIEQRYNIYIKQLSRKIKKIDITNPPKGSNNSRDYITYSDKDKAKNAIKNLAIIFISLISCFILLGIIGLILYPQHMKHYMAWLGFNISALCVAIKLFKDFL